MDSIRKLKEKYRNCYIPKIDNPKQLARTKNRKRVEKLLGYKLPSTVHIHHVDGNPLNNENSNLVVCQDIAYHKLLHKHQRFIEAWNIFCWAFNRYEDYITNEAAELQWENDRERKEREAKETQTDNTD